MSMRRQVLQSHSGVGKTISRRAKHRLEAQSVTSSPAQTPGGSKNASRNASQAGSGPTSRHGSVSPPSHSPAIVPLLPGDLADQLEDLAIMDPEQSLKDVIAQMDDRDFWKGSAKDRAKALNLYANSLAQLCATSEAAGFADEVVPIATRCLKEGTDSPSAIPACRVLALTALIDSQLEDDLLQQIMLALRHTITDNSNETGQAAAIEAFGDVVFFGPAMYNLVLDTMNYLIKIVQSDGEYVDADDSVKVVNCAIQTWAFLSTLVKPDDAMFGEALSSFEDQLKSSSIDIVLSAAQAISLLYERQYTLRLAEDDEDDDTEAEQAPEHISSGDDDEDHSDNEDESEAKPLYRKGAWKRKYFYTSGTHNEIREELHTLLNSRATRKNVPKAHMKDVKLVLRDVLYSIGRPYRGPRYSRALDNTDGVDKHYGHRLTVDDLVIDRWWKLHRLSQIRKLLKGGMAQGLHGNKVVMEALKSVAEPTSRFRHSAKTEEEE